MIARWTLLTGLAIACISVWSILIFSHFPDMENKVAETAPEEQGTPSGGNYASDPLALPDLETENISSRNIGEETGRKTEDVSADSSLMEEGKSENRKFSVRGIHPGDFDDIAPDKIISVDDLIERVKQDSE